MVLPMTFPIDPGGAVTGLRSSPRRYGKPIIVYVKAEGYLTPEGVKQLVDDGIVAAIKYAIVRPDPTQGRVPVPAGGAGGPPATSSAASASGR